MLAAINSSADPCDDFFNYACGNWMASHDILDNKTEASKFDDLKNEMKLVVQGKVVKTGWKGHVVKTGWKGHQFSATNPKSIVLENVILIISQLILQNC
jgi:predicted metalloendopeptidase